jgi:hypothetical protein
VRKHCWTCRSQYYYGLFVGVPVLCVTMRMEELFQRLGLYFANSNFILNFIHTCPQEKCICLTLYHQIKWIHPPWCTSHNTAHAYNEDCAIAKSTAHKVKRQHASNQCVSRGGLANILARKVMQSLLSLSLHYVLYLLIAPAQTDFVQAAVSGKWLHCPRHIQKKSRAHQ